MSGCSAFVPTGGPLMLAIVITLVIAVLYVVGGAWMLILALTGRRSPVFSRRVSVELGDAPEVEAE